MGRNKQYIGSNLLVALVESDGKEREKRDKNIGLKRQSFLFTVLLILIFSFSVSKDGWEQSGNQWKDLSSSDSKKILKKIKTRGLLGTHQIKERLNIEEIIIWRLKFGFDETFLLG